MNDHLKYILIKRVESKNIKVQLQDLDSFQDLISTIDTSVIFVQIKEIDADVAEEKGSFSEDFFNKTKQFASAFSAELDYHKQSKFYVIDNQICYWVNAQGFTTLEVYEKAKALGFDNADDYEASSDLKFDSAESYQAFKDNGFITKESYELAQQNGFLGAFEKIQSISDTLIPEAKTSVRSFNNDAEIYAIAKQKNYYNFDYYLTAIEKGFAQKDAADFELAKQAGFTCASQYYEAKNKGFERAEESEEAQQLQLGNKFEFDLYKKLNEVTSNFNFDFYDQAHIYKIITEYDSQELLSLSKIQEIFQSEKDKLGAKNPINAKGAEWLSNSLNKWLNTNAFPNWYKTSFKTKEELKTFIISNQQINTIGKFDLSSEIFTKN